MEYIIIGGDERLAHLGRMLRRQGREAGTLGREPVPGVPVLAADALESARNIVVNCPPKTKRGELAPAEIRRQAPGSTRIFLCGPKHPDVEDDRLIDLWADERLLLDNARLTAEGALSAAMRASRRAIGDMRCLVVGWGRIGQALTEILVALGADVTAASRSAAGRNRAVERGAEAVDAAHIAEALPGHRLVFNTAPAMVLDAAVLASADPDAMIIDLASPPYGVDLRAAWARGLRAWREPGLPGRYCPESAARALLNAILRHDKEGKTHG